MSQKGPQETVKETPKTPMRILQKISEESSDKLWPSSIGKDQDANAGNRARIFTDVSKDYSNLVQLEDKQYEEISKIIKGFSPPVTTETVDKVLNKFEEIVKGLTGEKDDNAPKVDWIIGDAQWNSFWQQVQKDYNLKDDEIKQRQGDVINGFRMKIFAMAQKRVEMASLKGIANLQNPQKARLQLKEENFELDRVIQELQKKVPVNQESNASIQKQIEDAKNQIEENNKEIDFLYHYDKEDKNGEDTKKKIEELKKEQGKILLFKDLVLKINIADRDAKEDVKRFDYVKDFYQKKFAVDVLEKFEINSIIAKAVEMKKQNVSINLGEELKAKWNEVIGMPLGDSRAAKFQQFFDKDESKDIFDDYFNEKAILEKVEVYDKVSKELGFDLFDKIKSLENLTGTKDNGLESDESIAIREHIIRLQELVYFPKQNINTNEDLRKPISREAYNESLQKLQSVLKTYSQRVAEAGNFDMLEKCFNIGIVSSDPKVTDFVKNTSFKATEEGNFEMLARCAKMGIVSDTPTTNYKRSIGDALRDGFKGFPRNLGQLFTKPERTPLQIAQMKGQTEIADNIVKAQQTKVTKSDIPEDLQLDSDTTKQMLERLENLEHKVVDLEGKIDLHESEKPSILTEMKIDTPMSSDKMDRKFVKAMMDLCAMNINNDVFKKTIEDLATNGCHSAILFKALALQGKYSEIKGIIGVDISEELKNMYVENEMAGKKEMEKIKPDDIIAIHPNLRNGVGKIRAEELLDVKKEDKDSNDNVVSIRDKRKK